MFFLNCRTDEHIIMLLFGTINRFTYSWLYKVTEIKVFVAIVGSLQVTYFIVINIHLAALVDHVRMKMCIYISSHLENRYLSTFSGLNMFYTLVGLPASSKPA